MKLELVAHSPDIEAIVATALLTTTSGSSPSALFHRLKGDPTKVADIVTRLELHHGSVLEHNRLCWLMEASEGEVIDIFLKNRFFCFSRLGPSRWLVSANIRTVIEFWGCWKDDFSKGMVESLRAAAPTLHRLLRGETDEG